MHRHSDIERRHGVFLAWQAERPLVWLLRCVMMLRRVCPSCLIAGVLTDNGKVQSETFFGSGLRTECPQLPPGVLRMQQAASTSQRVFQFPGPARLPNCRPLAWGAPTKNTRMLEQEFVKKVGLLVPNMGVQG